MNRKSLQKGFTLIELLVVVAIIGILSAIVLTALGGARNKAANASLQGSMSSIRAAAELFYDSSIPSSFINVCTDGSVQQLRIAAENQSPDGPGSSLCEESFSSYAVATQMRDTGSGAIFFCVDSSGWAGVITGTAGVAGSGTPSDPYACPIP